MPSDRFFIAGIHRTGDDVALDDDDARKLVTVLRGQTGDRIEVVDGAGTAFTAVLTIEGKVVRAALSRQLDASTTENRGQIVVAQAIPKGQKMDLIVEKVTELGAWAIVPLRSERVIGERTGDHKHERWQRIAKSAAQQSGRTRIPLVEPIADWPDLIRKFATFDRVFVAWERAAPVPLRERFERQTPRETSVLIAIGPEGGFSAREVETAVAAGAVPISLGSRILRTETAALVVLTAWLYARGEL